MKKLRYLWVLMILACCLYACKKGDPGLAGMNGTNGTNGKNGSQFFGGPTDPDLSIGVAGDFYINTATGVLFGPRAPDSWGVGYGLKGAPGTPGADGGKILTGSGTPLISVGNPGDYYLDKENYLLYGPKTQFKGWGTAVSLRLPEGTANVIYSAWKYATNVRDTNIDNSNLKAADLAAPELTTDVLNTGMTQVYMDYGGGPIVLPFTTYSATKLNVFSYFPRQGHFVITRFAADNSNSLNLSPYLLYRYVIIPGGIKTAVANHININDNAAVRRFYRLP